MNQKNRAWVYCRIDAPEDTHGALKGQRQQLIDYADKMGFAVVGSSEDLANGLSFDRPGLKRFAEAAESGNVDVLLVHNVSRIGSDTCQTMAYLERIAQVGVTSLFPARGKTVFFLSKNGAGYDFLFCNGSAVIGGWPWNRKKKPRSYTIKWQSSCLI